MNGFYFIKCRLIEGRTIGFISADYTMIDDANYDKTTQFMTFRFANKWSVNYWKLKHFNRYVILEEYIR